MLSSSSLLVDVLRQPTLLANLTLSQWDLLLPQARHTILLGHLSVVVDRQGLREKIPGQAMRHLDSGKLVSDKQRHSVHWELGRLIEAYETIGSPIILLKGAAYAVAGLRASEGRLFSDIDLLVMQTLIHQTEGILSLYGWVSGHNDEYDDRYYRQWMHEIPPLKHMRRNTILDVHHTILPPTGRYHPDPQKLINSAREVVEGVEVLCPEDMVIHSAAHLFHEGEFEHGLRDLVDLQQLLDQFGTQDAEFWQRLAPRAIELDLLRPLYYGLVNVKDVLGVDLPDGVMEQVKKAQPNVLMSPVMNSLFQHAFAPDHPSCDRPLTGLSRWLLYVRSHYLRMPLYLLVPHLVRKAWKSRMDAPEKLEFNAEGIQLPNSTSKPAGWRFWAR